ncbi:MAG: helix-turn-helix domain-containing protein [Lactobacillaceae bacterium]|nr:helix-turn-helix domain-containing protein [Lactobacillaceae bacterium]
MNTNFFDFILDNQFKNQKAIYDFLHSYEQQTFSLKEIASEQNLSAETTALNRVIKLINDINHFLPPINQTVMLSDDNKFVTIDFTKHANAYLLRRHYLETSLNHKLLSDLFDESISTRQAWATEHFTSVDNMKLIINDLRTHFAHFGIIINRNHQIVGNELQIRNWACRYIKMFFSDVAAEPSQTTKLRAHLTKLVTQYLEAHENLSPFDWSTMSKVVYTFDKRLQDKHILHQADLGAWYVKPTELSPYFQTILANLQNHLQNMYLLDDEAAYCEALYLVLIFQIEFSHDQGFWQHHPQNDQLNVLVETTTTTLNKYFNGAITPSQATTIRDLMGSPFMQHLMSDDLISDVKPELLNDAFLNHPIMANISKEILFATAQKLGSNKHTIILNLFQPLLTTLLTSLDDLAFPQVNVLVEYPTLPQLKAHIIHEIQGFPWVSETFVDSIASADITISDSLLLADTPHASFIYEGLPTDAQLNLLKTHLHRLALEKFNQRNHTAFTQKFK